jgi:hypothetical protein
MGRNTARNLRKRRAHQKIRKQLRRLRKQPRPGKMA